MNDFGVIALAILLVFGLMVVIWKSSSDVIRDENGQPVDGEPEPRQPVPASRALGVLLGLGGAAAIIFALQMDVSVSTGYGEVNNIGLMSDRQNYILIGIGAAIVGTLIFLLGGRRAS